MAKTQTLLVLNQSVADLSKAVSIVHQVHWYMRGPGFMRLHKQMDRYMEELNGYLDDFSERLIMLGGAPYSTLKEFDEQSKLVETSGDYTKSVQEHVERVIGVFRYLAEQFQEGLDATDEEGDDVANGLYADAKGAIEKHIWMLQAELGQAPNL